MEALHIAGIILEALTVHLISRNRRHAFDLYFSLAGQEEPSHSSESTKGERR